MSDAAPKFDSDRFWKEQDFQTSARLHLQHWIWKYQLEYTLHPKIELERGKSIRIADVACGNGAWLLDFSQDHPKYKYDGFDITAAHFPAAEWLAPKNINLHVWNAFSELPSEYVGVFDIVHVRTIFSAIRDNNIEPLLSNMLKMLKPGGYLQWDESYKIQAHAPSENVDADAMRKLVAIHDFMSKHMSKLHNDWLDDLPSTLTSKGLEVLARDSIPARPELGRAWSDNLLTVWRGVIPMLPEAEMPLPPGMGLPDKLSRLGFAELVSRAAQESSKGVSADMEQCVIVARK